MATYNGAQYIQEQLQSLIDQWRQPDELVVCDDGSQDNTVSILESFAKSAPFPVRIYRNEKNLGYTANFFKAARLCGGDWVALCDQDDVWLCNKLSAAESAIIEHPNLVMVLQNSELCDGNLNPRGRLFPNKMRGGVYGANSQYGFWVWPGFLQTVKSEFFKKINSGEVPLNYFPGHPRQSHDKWTCMISNALGGICVLSQPAALYRRHEGALTGRYAGKSIGERVNASRNVDSAHYRFLVTVARSSASYLTTAAEEASDEYWRNSFIDAAQNFENLAIIQAEWAALYESADIFNRIGHFIKIGRMGGYIGPSFSTMGIKSALKDLTKVFCRSLIKARQPL